MKCLCGRIQILPFDIQSLNVRVGGWAGFKFYVSDGRNFLGNEKILGDRLDQGRDGLDQRQVSAIMMVVVAPNYLCPKYCTCSFQEDLLAIIGDNSTSLANT